MSFAMLAVVHLAATGFMTGLIWTVHTVHYPLFALVNEPHRPFQEAHMARITALLVVPWGVESLSAVALVVVANETGERAVAAAGLALLVAVVAITGLGAAPIHGRLRRALRRRAAQALASGGPDPDPPLVRPAGAGRLVGLERVTAGLGTTGARVVRPRRRGGPLRPPAPAPAPSAPGSRARGPG